MLTLAFIHNLKIRVCLFPY